MVHVHGIVKSEAAISGKFPEWYMIHIPLLGIAYGKNVPWPT